MRINIPFVGFLTGLVLPAITVAVLYFVFGKGTTFESYITDLFKDGDLAAKILSLGLIANVLPIMYFSSKRYDYALRGLFSAFILYAVLILLLKFVW